MLSIKDCLEWLPIIDAELSKLKSWQGMSADDKVLILKMYAATHEQRMVFGCAMQAVKAQFTNLTN